MVKLTGQPSLCAFARTDANQSLLVIHNLGQTNATVKLPQGYQEYKTIYFSTKTPTIKSNQVQIPEYSTVVLSK